MKYLNLQTKLLVLFFSLCFTTFYLSAQQPPLIKPDNIPTIHYIAPKGIELDTTQTILPLMELLEFDPTRKFVEFKGMVMNEDMPRFIFTDINGKDFSSEDVKNKIVIINFWATWCAPCMAPIEHTKALMKKYAAYKDVVFIFISIDSDFDSWREYLKNHPIDGIHGNDKLILPINFQVMGIPNTFIVGRNGKIAYNSRLKTQLSDEAIIEILLK